MIHWHSIASALFLLRLRWGRTFKFRESEVVTSGQRCMLICKYLLYTANYCPQLGSYPARLRALFWIALSNFVLPVIFNIVELIMIFSGVGYIPGADIMMVTPYMEIIGVLLATLMCSGRR